MSTFTYFVVPSKQYLSSYCWRYSLYISKYIPEAVQHVRNGTVLEFLERMNYG